MGSNKSNLGHLEGMVLRRETHPLPKTPTGIGGLVQEILKSGGWVERIVIQNGEPVQAYRYVEDNGLGEEDIDLQSALRKADLVELDYKPSDDPWRQIGSSMQALRYEGLWSVCWVVGSNTDYLRKWLNLGNWEDLSYLLGVPVQKDNSLPPETLILAGAKNSEAQVRDIVAAFKLVMEEHREQESNRPSNRSRSNSRRNAPRSKPVGDSGFGNIAEGWKPPGFIRKKLRS